MTQQHVFQASTCHVDCGLCWIDSAPTKVNVQQIWPPGSQSDDPLCCCGEVLQTMAHIVNFCAPVSSWIIIIIIIIIIINEKINVAYSPKTSRTRDKQKKKTATRSVDGSTIEVSAISTVGMVGYWSSTVYTLLTMLLLHGLAVHAKHRRRRRIKHLQQLEMHRDKPESSKTFPRHPHQ